MDTLDRVVLLVVIIVVGIGSCVASIAYTSSYYVPIESLTKTGHGEYVLNEQGLAEFRFKP